MQYLTNILPVGSFFCTGRNSLCKINLSRVSSSDPKVFPLFHWLFQPRKTSRRTGSNRGNVFRIYSFSYILQNDVGLGSKLSTPAEDIFNATDYLISTEYIPDNKVVKGINLWSEIWESSSFFVKNCRIEIKHTSPYRKIDIHALYLSLLVTSSVLFCSSLVGMRSGLG